MTESHTRRIVTNAIQTSLDGHRFVRLGRDVECQDVLDVARDEGYEVGYEPDGDGYDVWGWTTDTPEGEHEWRLVVTCPVTPGSVSTAAATLGRKGGAVRSAAKRAAARRNIRQRWVRDLAYEQSGEWGSVRIHRRPQGWRVEYESATTGQTTGDVWLVPYSDEWRRDLDLRAGLPAHGDRLAHVARLSGRRLKRGLLVR